MKLYEYMVTYCYPGGNGRVGVTIDKEINSYDDVESVDKIVRETITNVTDEQKSKAFVTDFKLLRVVKENEIE